MSTLKGKSKVEIFGVGHDSLYSVTTKELISFLEKLPCTVETSLSSRYGHPWNFRKEEDKKRKRKTSLKV
jgi:hypothetical protein